MCLTRPGQLVGGAMIHRGSDDGQPQRHINRVMKVNQLNGNQPLVVIHGNDGIEFTFVSAVKEGVGGHGADHLAGLVLESLNHRLNQLQFFTPKETALTGMRIESGHPQTHR